MKRPTALLALGRSLTVISVRTAESAAVDGDLAAIFMFRSLNARKAWGPTRGAVSVSIPVYMSQAG